MSSHINVRKNFEKKITKTDVKSKSSKDNNISFRGTETLASKNFNLPELAKNGIFARNFLFKKAMTVVLPLLGSVPVIAGMAKVFDIKGKKSIKSKTSLKKTNPSAYHIINALRNPENNNIALTDITKFKTEEQLFDYFECLAMKEEVKTKKIEAIHTNFAKSRIEEVNRWAYELLKYPVTIRLIVMKGIHSFMRGNNKNILPPILESKIIKKTISQIEKNPEQNFIKAYGKNLTEFYMSKYKLKSIAPGFMIIPKAERDESGNITEEGIEMIKVLRHLSAPTWCTSSLSAEEYLPEGDFHIYRKNGKSKIGIRFTDNEIAEIRDNFNNDFVSAELCDILLSYLEKLKQNFPNLKYSEFCSKEIEVVKKNKIINDNRGALLKAFKDNNATYILNFFGVITEEDVDGMLTIANFDVLKLISSIKGSLGIDPDICKLLKKIKKINGYANFGCFNINSLENLEEINGDAYFGYSLIEDFGKLKTITGNAVFINAKLKTDFSIRDIGGNLDLNGSDIIDTGYLENVGGNLYLSTGTNSVKNLRNVNGDIYAIFTHLKEDDFINVRARNIFLRSA